MFYRVLWRNLYMLKQNEITEILRMRKQFIILRQKISKS